MKGIVHNPKNRRFLSALGGLLLMLALVLVACGGSNQSTSTRTPKPGTTLFTYHGGGSGVAWSPNGKYIASTGEEDNTVQVWEAMTGKLTSSYSVQDQGLGFIGWPAWSPDGKYIVSGGCDAVVKVIDAMTGKLQLTYRGHPVFKQDTEHGQQGNCVSAAWSPNGKYIASGGEEGTVQVWDAMTGKLFLTYHQHAGGVMVVAWSPDGRYIASSGDEFNPDKSVQVWDAMTGKLLLTYRGHSANVISLSWSPDGKYLASVGNDTTMQVWESMTGKLFLTYHAHPAVADGQQSGFISATWSPNGKYIVASEFIPAGPDVNKSTVQVFDAMTGKLVLTYRGHASLAWSVAWSPDGTRIASASEDGTTQVWQAP